MRARAAIERLGEGRLVVDRPADSAAGDDVRAIVYGVTALLLASRA